GEGESQRQAHVTQTNNRHARLTSTKLMQEVNRFHHLTPSKVNPFQKFTLHFADTRGPRGQRKLRLHSRLQPSPLTRGRRQSIAPLSPPRLRPATSSRPSRAQPDCRAGQPWHRGGHPPPLVAPWPGSPDCNSWPTRPAGPSGGRSAGRVGPG